jgi:hypothetical protein
LLKDVALLPYFTAEHRLQCEIEISTKIPMPPVTRLLRKDEPKLSLGVSRGIGAAAGYQNCQKEQQR